MSNNMSVSQKNFRVATLTESDLFKIALEKAGVVGETTSLELVDKIPALQSEQFLAKWIHHTGLHILVLAGLSSRAKDALREGRIVRFHNDGLPRVAAEKFDSIVVTDKFILSPVIGKIYSEERLVFAFEKYPTIIGGKVELGARKSWLKTHRRRLVNSPFPQMGNIGMEVRAVEIFKQLQKAA